MLLTLVPEYFSKIILPIKKNNKSTKFESCLVLYSYSINNCIHCIPAGNVYYSKKQSVQNLFWFSLKLS